MRYRITPGVGVALIALKTKKNSLTFEAGPAYVWEKVSNKRDRYLAMRLEERFEHEIRSGSRIWHWLEYVPSSEDLKNYLINAESGMDVSVTEKLKLRLMFQDKYNSSPAEQMKRNDLALVTGLGFYF